MNVDDTFLCPKNLVGKINSDLHTCNTVNYRFEDLKVSNENYFIVGMKSFGKYSNFLLASGYKVLDELVEHLLEKESIISK